MEQKKKVSTPQSSSALTNQHEQKNKGLTPTQATEPTTSATGKGTKAQSPRQDEQTTRREQGTQQANEDNSTNIQQRVKNR